MKHKLGKSKARQLSQVYAQRTAKLKSVVAIDKLEDDHSRGIIDKGTENFPSKRSSVSTSNQSSKIGDKEDESLIKEEEDLIREKAFTTMKTRTTPDISQQLQAELRKCEEVEALLMESSTNKHILQRDALGDFDVSRQRRKNKIYGVGLLPQKQDFSTSPDEFFSFGPLKDKDIAQFACSIKGENVLCLSSESDLYWWDGDDDENAYNGYSRVSNSKNIDSDTNIVKMPELVKTMALEKILHNRHIISIACGSKHCCVVCQSGDVFTWGLAANGRLGLSNHQEKICPLSARK